MLASRNIVFTPRARCLTSLCIISMSLPIQRLLVFLSFFFVLEPWWGGRRESDPPSS